MPCPACHQRRIDYCVFPMSLFKDPTDQDKIWISFGHQVMARARAGAGARPTVRAKARARGKGLYARP